MKKLEWEKIDGEHERAKVIGGWLVKVSTEVCSPIQDYKGRPQFGYEWRVSMCFVPDEGYNWGSQDDK